jgi:uncharacterized protein YjdB
MKNYFKKFSTILMMVLTIIGIGMIQNVSIANAATVGQVLAQPESGWQRFDDNNPKIKYTNFTQPVVVPGYYYKDTVSTLDYKGNATFKFKGRNLRLIGPKYTTFSYNILVSIDGVVETFSENSSGINQALVYEKLNLSDSVHTVIISKDDTRTMKLDALDIDSNGYLLSYDESISLDKSTLNLIEGSSDELTATTTPAGAQVTWTSDNTSVATVDSTGKVTGVKEGNCTITATTVDGLTATCTVTVTKKDDPQPTNPTGDANLFIELVDGQIKQYTVSQDEINKFTSWFENRDNDHSLTATYKFTKGTYKDYVVHDQIDWFEVR